jgi:succinoglycan biosynthesis protein ExoO
LRIGEDDDLIVRLLHAGLKYRLAPQLTYFYRKHDASISHRIGSGHLDQMIANAAVMKTAWVGSPLPVTAALARREASFLDAKAFVGMIEALKTRNLGQGLGFGAPPPFVISPCRWRRASGVSFRRRASCGKNQRWRSSAASA